MQKRLSRLIPGIQYQLLCHSTNLSCLPPLPPSSCPPRLPPLPRELLLSLSFCCGCALPARVLLPASPTAPVPSHCPADGHLFIAPLKIRWFILRREDTTQKQTVWHSATNCSESPFLTRNYRLYKTLALAVIKNPNALRRMNL